MFSFLRAVLRRKPQATEHPWTQRLRQHYRDTAVMHGGFCTIHMMYQCPAWVEAEYFDRRPDGKPHAPIHSNFSFLGN
jgi:hypothetical protein